MGGLSIWHILAVVAVIAVVFGHRHIPALLGTLGAMIGSARKTTKRRPKAPDIIEGTFVRRDD